MKLELLEWKWDQVTGQMREKWDQLTPHDMVVVHRNRDLLLGKLSERYGYSKAEAKRQLEAFVRDCTPVKNAVQ